MPYILQNLYLIHQLTHLEPVANLSFVKGNKETIEPLSDQVPVIFAFGDNFNMAIWNQEIKHLNLLYEGLHHFGTRLLNFRPFCRSLI